jgi:hypothetical protein
MELRRPPIVILTFAGGPWDGRVQQSDDPPTAFRIDGDGEYVLKAWSWTHGECRASYAWDDEAAAPPGID